MSRHICIIKILFVEWVASNFLARWLATCFLTFLQSLKFFIFIIFHLLNNKIRNCKNEFLYGSSAEPALASMYDIVKCL